MTGAEIAYFAVAAAAAGATAYGIREQNQAVAATNRANETAAEYNADVAAQNAEVARRNAGAREDSFRREQRQFLAKQRATATQSGFDAATGSLGLVLEQSADEAELDALTIRHEGEMEARGYASQSVLDRFNAKAYGMNARAANRAGNIGAASSLLSSASSMYGAGMKMGSFGSGGGTNRANGMKIPGGG